MTEIIKMRMSITDGSQSQTFETWAQIKEWNGHWALFEPNQWSPGVWAGSEGAKVSYHNKHGTLYYKSSRFT